MVKPADIGFAVIEVGSWVAIGKTLLKRERWGTLDAFWLWFGSPASLAMSLLDGLYLYASLWGVWTVLLAVKRHRRERSVTEP